MGFWDKVRDVVKGEPASRQPSMSARAEPTPTTPTPAPASAPQSERPAPPYEVYTVKNGDTLDEIGARFGVGGPDIARLNDIADPKLIYPGQIFKIPSR